VTPERPSGHLTESPQRISDIWLRAAVLGSLWAAHEIVIGSALHNLRIPLAGTLLSAIGAAILIGGHRLWPRQGLLWRTGLICAVMKSLSPSALILGPMVAIVMEGMILEGAVRAFGPRAPAYLIGGALAVSWSFVQKIITLTFTFGFNLVTLYERLYQLASRSLGVTGFGAFDLILALLGINFLFGLAVAAIAMKLGQLARTLPPLPYRADTAEAGVASGLNLDVRQRFSLPLLPIHAGAMAAGLLLLAGLPIGYGALYVAAYAPLVLARYHRSLRRLRRPRIWIWLVAVLLLSGFLLSGLQPGGVFWSWSGLQAGLSMTLRAILIILGFSALSVELRNPVILAWFARRGMRQFPLALDVAFEALPKFLAVVSQERGVFRRPLEAIPRLLQKADQWLHARLERAAAPPPVFFLSGERASGKTSLARGIVDRLRQEGLSVAGILAPGLRLNGDREGFDVLDLRSGARIPLCRRSGIEGTVTAGSFIFSAEGLALGLRSLDPAAVAESDIVVVDEVGPLELEGKGWSPALRSLMRGYRNPMVWVVRRGLTEAVAQNYAVNPLAVWQAPSIDPEEAVRQILAVRFPQPSQKEG
jgi:nucleoside-triphosphatase THEP1